MVDSFLSKKIPARIKRLEDLAYNIWWSWHLNARDVFRALDYPLWRNSGHNPVEVLYQTTEAKLNAAAADPAFLFLYDEAIATLDAYLASTHTWFADNYSGRLNGPIAYFSMEFALHSSLPMYAGGLGILAGDICKEASDLGLPMIGIGFMYPQGYFHQHISAEGWQEEVYSQLSFDEAPIQQVLTAQGSRSIARVKLGDHQVSLAVWEVKVGRVKLFLLDTNVDGNSQADRELSARLYTSDPETRIRQEIILGIGGVKVLRALGVRPSRWHANEGHSAFMTLERIREEVALGLEFEAALEKVKETSVFTTHTPVSSGHDVFNLDLFKRYFDNSCQELGIDFSHLCVLGSPGEKVGNGFNMTALAIKTSSGCNAVSMLHEIETKKMWRGIWPGTSLDQLPITHVTNGVHVPTWIGPEFRALFDKYLGKDWINRQDDHQYWKRLMYIPDEEIWSIHRFLKGRLLEVISGRARMLWAEGQIDAEQVIAMGSLLNPTILTLCFARRFAEYKRPDLILRDPERLEKILNNPLYPVQIIFTGKAHPADGGGKNKLHSVFSAALNRALQGRVAFVEDYDMHLARYLTHGVDVWLNNPLRLLEASGTSGMKAGLNGVINLSVLDGWWNEGFNGKNGWAIGAGPEAAFTAEQDADDAEAIYNLLEKEIVPLYYSQDRSGIPHGWVQMLKESICSIMPGFCAARMVKEYTGNLYCKNL
jgi:glycogen phosphorylase